MRTYRVAILSTTGAVGQEMIEILMERSFLIHGLRFLANTRNAGRKLTVVDREYIVEETTENSFGGMDIVLGATGSDIAEKYLPIAAKGGAVVVGDSSAFRLDEQVPLIVPEVNPQTVCEHHGIIADPNCATTIALVALQSLYAYTNAKRMVISIYQTVSGAGVSGIHELNQQVDALAHDKEVAVNTFQYQIAYNLIPQIGSFNETEYSNEEMKVRNERRRTISNPKLCVNCTCVRVPMIHSHSESTMVEFEKETSVEKARELLQEAPGVKLVDGPQRRIYPMPLDTTDQDLVSVSRIHEDMSGHANALSFWCYGDQVYKRAVTSAAQTAELVIQEKEEQQE